MNKINKLGLIFSTFTNPRYGKSIPQINKLLIFNDHFYKSGVKLGGKKIEKRNTHC